MNVFIKSFRVPALVFIITAWAGLQAVRAQVRASIDLSQMRFDTTLSVKQDRARAIPTDRRVDLSQGEIIVGRTGRTAVATTTVDKLKYRMPYELYFVTPGGGSRNMRPVVEVEGGGFRVRRGIQGFAGSLQIGLQDSADPQSSESIGQKVNLLVTAVADSVSRPNLRLDHTNLPFELVEIFSVNPPDSVRVRIKPSFDPAGIEFAVPVLRPTLNISFAPEDGVQGYGLETATIIVQIDGTPEPEGLTVSLVSDKGQPEPARVSLDASGTGQASIRSIGRGAANVTASTPLSGSISGRIEFLFPTMFLIFATVGGLLGGVGRLLQQKLKTSSVVTWKIVGLYLASGLVFGYILAGLSAIGINVSPFKPTANTGEALVCFLSALGGFGGSALLSKFLGIGPSGSGEH